MTRLQLIIDRVVAGLIVVAVYTLLQYVLGLYIVWATLMEMTR